MVAPSNIENCSLIAENYCHCFCLSVLNKKLEQIFKIDHQANITKGISG